MDVRPEWVRARIAGSNLLGAPLVCLRIGLGPGFPRPTEGNAGPVAGFHRDVPGRREGRARGDVDLLMSGGLHVVRHLKILGSEPEGVVTGPIGTGLPRGRLAVLVTSSGLSGEQVATPSSKAQWQGLAAPAGRCTRRLPWGDGLGHPGLRVDVTGGEPLNWGFCLFTVQEPPGRPEMGEGAPQVGEGAPAARTRLGRGRGDRRREKREIQHRPYTDRTQDHSFGGLRAAKSNRRSSRKTRFPWLGRWWGFKACALATTV